MLTIALIIAAFAMAKVVPWIAAGGTAVLALGAMYRTRGYVRGSELQGQLEAKDTIIGTNEQTITALEHRVSALEEQLKSIVRDNHALHIGLEKQRAESLRFKTSYEELLKVSEQYSAPAAIRHFEKVLNDRAPRFDNIETSLLRIEAKLDGRQA